MKSFTVKLIALTLGLALAGWLVFSLFIPGHYLAVMPFLLLFFFLSTFIIHWIQLQLAQKDLGKFTRSNMIITFGKLLLYSILTIIYVVIDKQNTLTFVICMFLLYFIFNLFEVVEISKVSRNNK